ncbi:MAG: lectin [Acidimicrobiia bacterium]|nr:lectin [Acidimicrobiia bacterium]
MSYMRVMLAVVTLVVSLGSYLALAQQPQQPPVPMSFFVTSVGLGRGANLGGLAGADAHCQALATKAGRGNVKWVAYLSTQGAGAVNARDRIGNGPWNNARGQMVAMNQDELHGDTINMARQGNRINKERGRDENGNLVKGVGDMPNEHDMLTGSNLEGRAYTDNMDHTCSNWTSGADGMGSAQLGHHDKIGNGSGSWNSAHASRGCSQPNLVSTGGAGLFYCFAPGN